MEHQELEEPVPPRPAWAPDTVPLERPSVARIYDYHLGGFHNVASDRRAAEAAAAGYPDLPLIMRLNRTFLRRAVQYLVGQGIRQFLDLGSGIPTVGNVHEVAQAVQPASRVVYVDDDPVAVGISEVILDGRPNVGVLQADIRFPERVLAHPVVARWLDFERPVAILLVFVLHFVPEEEAASRLVRVLRDAMAPGSYLVISHGTAEPMAPRVVAEQTALTRQTSHTLHLRSRAQIAAYFGELTMVDPGLVYLPLWRPESVADLWLDQPERSASFGGIGRKV
jgi:hypothetical protein